MENKFTVSSSPHYRSDRNTRRIMADVIIALAPMLCVAVIYRGFYVLLLTAVSVLSCVVFEFLFDLIRKRKTSVTDLSAIVTGILTAFCVPPTAPVWLVVIGDFFAIVIVKKLFGGLGKNIFNPALAARAFLFSWPVIMTTFSDVGADAVTSATPLASLSNGQLPEESLLDMFLGFRGGSIGETCIAALLLGAAYLLFRRVISWHIPVAYIGTVAILTFLFPIFGNEPFDIEFTAMQLMSGGLVLGAFFMATDYTTSPVTAKGMLIYGVGCGILTVFMRAFGSYGEGVSYAILIMNVFAVALDKITRPKRYGKGGVDLGKGK